METETRNNAMVTEDEMWGHDYDSWVERMRNRGFTIPNQICFRAAPGSEVTAKYTREATLDELAAAMVMVEKEMEDLRAVANGLKEIQRRVRDTAHLPGDTTVIEALFPKGDEHLCNPFGL